MKSFPNELSNVWLQQLHRLVRLAVTGGMAGKAQEQTEIRNLLLSDQVTMSYPPLREIEKKNVFTALVPFLVCSSLAVDWGWLTGETQDLHQPPTTHWLPTDINITLNYQHPPPSPPRPSEIEIFFKQPLMTSEAAGYQESPSNTKYYIQKCSFSLFGCQMCYFIKSNNIILFVSLYFVLPKQNVNWIILNIAHNW